MARWLGFSNIAWIALIVILFVCWAYWVTGQALLVSENHDDIHAIRKILREADLGSVPPKEVKATVERRFNRLEKLINEKLK